MVAGTVTENSRLVYSTDGGRVKPARPAGVAPAPNQAAPNDGVVRIQRDRRGRGGKTATTITGLPGSPAELDAVLRELKQYCGAGGARNGSMLEIQGDQRERLRERLGEMGYRVRLAGG